MIGIGYSMREREKNKIPPGFLVRATVDEEAQRWNGCWSRGNQEFCFGYDIVKTTGIQI